MKGADHEFLQVGRGAVMADKSVSMTFVCEPELRKQFTDLCRADDKSAAQVIRAMMRDYIKRQGQGRLPFKSESKADGS